MKSANSLKNLRKFKKGQSGNPKGRAKGVRLWRNVYRDLFESGRLKQDDIALSVAKQAKKGNVKAAALIYERMDGKPVEKIETQTTPGINLFDLPEDLRKEVAQEILEGQPKRVEKNNQEDKG